MEEICPVLPQDLLDNILVRLPVKSVGRSRCVSKPWRSLLSSPHFLKAHFKFHLHNPPENLLVLTDCHSSAVCICSSISINGGNDCVSREVTVPHIEGFSRVIAEGSCHGLLLLSQKTYNSEKVLVLFNPVTLEAEEITNFWFYTASLGYDSLNDDFKVVLTSENPVRNTADDVDVYSVKTKVWKKAANSDYNFYKHDEVCLSGVFLNGCIHWLASLACKPCNVIAAFSLARQEFKSIHLPTAKFDSPVILSDLGGCLTLVVETESSTSAEVWMMKAYGVQESWMKFSITYPSVAYPRPPSITHSHKLVCFLGDDEIVLMRHSNCKQFSAYNLGNGSWRNLVIAGLPLYFLRCARTFTSSLASPNNYGIDE